MSRITTLAVVALMAAFAASYVGCEAIFKPDTKAVADNALLILRSMRGSTSNCYEPGAGPEGLGMDGVDSVYVDEITAGVWTRGWMFYDDLETPFDSTDDVVSFRGTKDYLDWEVLHNVWLSVHIWQNDRATEMSVKNVTSGDSSHYVLGPVNRPGGVQMGPASWTNVAQTVELIMGIHHNETPDDWTDNYSFTRFMLNEPREASVGYLVHADHRPDNSGSGEIREQDDSGPLVATFQWDNFGRGSLVVGGDIYPFRW